jgi:UDP-glucose 4-epimerase
VVNERFFVTGGSGLLGAWVIKRLLDAECEVLTDTEDDRRLRLIGTPARTALLRRVEGLDSRHRVTHLVHTSTVTERTCLEDPSGSATSAIGGFADTIRAAAEAGVTGMSFQSSMSVFAPSSAPVGELTEPAPVSAFGTYHLNQEILARRRFCEFGLASHGVRTGLVYGPGQDPDVDGGASNAIAAASEDRWSQLRYCGVADFQYVDDVARALIDAARRPDGHSIASLQGDSAAMVAFCQAVAAITGSSNVSVGSTDFPFPLVSYQEQGRLETSLEDGIRATIETLRWAPRDLCSWN